MNFIRINFLVTVYFVVRSSIFIGMRVVVCVNVFVVVCVGVTFQVVQICLHVISCTIQCGDRCVSSFSMMCFVVVFIFIVVYCLYLFVCATNCTCMSVVQYNFTSAGVGRVVWFLL